MDNYEKEAIVLLNPIMDLFSGADGGVAYSRMRHGFVPKMIEKLSDGYCTDAEYAAIDALTKTSKLCQAILDGKL